MPSVEQTVSSITVEDGRGGSWKNTYAYSGGKYSFAERRFLGFATETETLRWHPACSPTASSAQQSHAR